VREVYVGVSGEIDVGMKLERVLKFRFLWRPVRRSYGGDNADMVSPLDVPGCCSSWPCNNPGRR
jgi:hypothetical protein